MVEENLKRLLFFGNAFVELPCAVMIYDGQENMGMLNISEIVMPEYFRNGYVGISPK